jgi:spermidine/putrescine transport system ATP-binding protein
MNDGDHRSKLAVELKNVSKHYAQHAALNNVSLVVHQGEFYTLLGPSGCGKTTTLNIIAGFVPITEGELYINGKLMRGDPPYKRNVNTVFQNYALFPHLTVAQNIGFGPRMHKTPPDEIEKKVEAMLSLISLPSYGDRYPKQLSGGQQQRVALARALVNQPDVLLLDEPLGALDLKIRKQLQVELANIQRKVGITFVYVTHDQEEALALSDRIAVMSEGQIAQEGAPSEIYSHPNSRFVANFIGESNFFNGKVTEIRGSDVYLDLPGFANPHGVSDNDLQPGQEVAVMVRPEWLECSLRPFETTDNVTEAKTTDAIFMGTHFRLLVETKGGTFIIVHLPPSEETKDISPWLQQNIYVRWLPAHGRILKD